MTHVYVKSDICFLRMEAVYAALLTSLEIKAATLNDLSVLPESLALRGLFPLSVKISDTLLKERHHLEEMIKCYGFDELYAKSILGTNNIDNLRKRTLTSRVLKAHFLSDLLDAQVDIYEAYRIISL